MVDMHKELSSQGFEILAFPCNQFFSQESGSPEEIKKFVD
jgi:glutathione peroxidase